MGFNSGFKGLILVLILSVKRTTKHTPFLKLILNWSVTSLQPSFPALTKSLLVVKCIVDGLRHLG